MEIKTNNKKRKQNMKHTLKSTRALAVTLITFGALIGGSDAASVLLASDSNATIDMEPRFSALGHTVTVSDPSTWSSTFDYSVYDVVVIGFQSFTVADEANLVSSVTDGTVGILIGRAFGSGSTSISSALGLTGGADQGFQNTNMTVLVNTHPITSHLSLGLNNFGYSFASSVNDTVVANATVLMTGSSGTASLVVHNSLRAAIIPYYGHPDNENLATPDALAVTNNSVIWAATVPEPSSALLLILGALGLVARRRRDA